MLRKLDRRLSALEGSRTASCAECELEVLNRRAAGDVTPQPPCAHRPKLPSEVLRELMELDYMDKKATTCN